MIWKILSNLNDSVILRLWHWHKKWCFDRCWFVCLKGGWVASVIFPCSTVVSLKTVISVLQLMCTPGLPFKRGVVPSLCFLFLIVGGYVRGDPLKDMLPSSWLQYISNFYFTSFFSRTIYQCRLICLLLLKRSIPEFTHLFPPRPGPCKTWLFTAVKSATEHVTGNQQYWGSHCKLVQPWES